MAQGKKMIRINACELQQYQRTQMQKDMIIKRLREQGCRITRQRLMLLDIILEGGCSCCKEIYYKAVKQDRHIGTATVYRMVNTLEEMGAISRRNMYQVACTKEGAAQNVCSIELNDDTVCELSEEHWNQVLQEGLRACGYLKNQKVRRVAWFRQ